MKKTYIEPQIRVVALDMHDSVMNITSIKQRPISPQPGGDPESDDDPDFWGN